MAEYTFSVDGRDLGDERVETRVLENDKAAMDVGARTLGPQHQSVSVGRGSGDAVEWLGAWDWCEGAPRWTRDE